MILASNFLNCVFSYLALVNLLWYLDFVLQKGIRFYKHNLKILK